MQKLYLYVDETGQDTEGRFFLVAVVTSDKEHKDILEQKLELIEQSSRKGKRKWERTRWERKIAYLQQVLTLQELRESIFYAIYHNSKDYTPLFSLTIAQAITTKAQGDYQVIVYVDGANREEEKKIAKGLMQLGIRRKKVKGMRDESNALMRLADKRFQ